MSTEVIMPTRTFRDYLESSLVWDDFLTRGGFAPTDLVVADPFKAGTTWTQRIVQQILDNGVESEAGLSDTSPWLDSSWGDHARMLAVLEEQKKRGQRRVIKSHLPADALPISPEAHYLFVGRNGKDLVLSLHNYLAHFSAATMTAIDRVHASWSTDQAKLEIPPDAREFFDKWLATDGYGCCALFDIVRSWWKLRAQPNVVLVHYQRLVDDLPAQIVRIARFIGVVPATLNMPAIEEHCSFAYMRTRAEKLAPFGGAHMGDPKAFFHKGPERDFRAVLTPEQIDRFDQAALDALGLACARWLETGEEPPATLGAA